MAVIAILDDNLNSCRLLERLLRMAGHVTTCIPVGDAVIESLAQTRPDLLLLDMNLPGLSGMALLKLLRRDPQLRDLPVVVFSGVSDYEVQQEAFQLGVLDYIVKGWDWEAALPRIEQHLRKN